MFFFSSLVYRSQSVIETLIVPIDHNFKIFIIFDLSQCRIGFKRHVSRKFQCWSFYCFIKYYVSLMTSLYYLEDFSSEPFYIWFSFIRVWASASFSQCLKVIMSYLFFSFLFIFIWDSLSLSLNLWNSYCNSGSVFFDQIWKFDRNLSQLYCARRQYIMHQARMHDCV